MERISNVDRIAMLLRQKLLERARAAGSSRSGRVSAQPRRLDGKAAAKALAELEGVDEHELRRAMVQTVLGDQFGEDLVNDAQFQQVIARVTELINEAPEAADLLTRTINDLKR